MVPVARRLRSSRRRREIAQKKGPGTKGKKGTQAHRYKTKGKTERERTEAEGERGRD